MPFCHSTLSETMSRQIFDLQIKKVYSIKALTVDVVPKVGTLWKIHLVES